MPFTQRQRNLLRLQARIDQVIAEARSLVADRSLSRADRRLVMAQLRLRQDAMRRVDRLIGEAANS
jgi:hypothetical protein